LKNQVQWERNCNKVVREGLTKKGGI